MDESLEWLLFFLTAALAVIGYALSLVLANWLRHSLYWISVGFGLLLPMFAIFMVDSFLAYAESFDYWFYFFAVAGIFLISDFQFIHAGKPIELVAGSLTGHLVNLGAWLLFEKMGVGPLPIVAGGVIVIIAVRGWLRTLRQDPSFWQIVHLNPEEAEYFFRTHPDWVLVPHGQSEGVPQGAHGPYRFQASDGLMDVYCTARQMRPSQTAFLQQPGLNIHRDDD